MTAVQSSVGDADKILQMFTSTPEPKYPSYTSQPKREGSYRNWPCSMPQRPFQLAEAGFYYMDKGDMTSCFHCGGGLKNWSTEDIPWVEHAKWYGDCQYLIKKKGLDFVKAVKSNKPFAKFLLPSQQIVAHAARKPSAPPMEMESCLDEICESGFAEKDDICSKPSFPSPTQASLKEKIKEQQSKNRALSEEKSNLLSERRCRICMDHNSNVLFLPCKHLLCCTDCALSFHECPICRKSVGSFVRVFPQEE